MDKTSTEVQILFSDEAVDNAGKRDNTRYIASLLFPSDSKWYFVFRESLGNAPDNILATLIQHELIRGFLLAEEAFPTTEGQKHLTKYKNELKILAAKEPSILSDPDEALVGVINLNWCGDEMAALKWLGEP